MFQFDQDKHNNDIGVHLKDNSKSKISMSSNLLGDNSIQEGDLPDLSIGSRMDKSGLEGDATPNSSSNATPREEEQELV